MPGGLALTLSPRKRTLSRAISVGFSFCVNPAPDNGWPVGKAEAKRCV